MFEFLMGEYIAAAVRAEFNVGTWTGKINALYVLGCVGLVTLQGTVTLIKWAVGALNV